MTEFLRTWLFRVICAALVMAITECIAQNGKVKHVCRLAGGAIMVIAVMSPFVSVNELSLEGLGTGFALKAEAYREELSKTRDFFLETIIEEKTAAYILGKAEELGVHCHAEVTPAWKDGLPYLHSVKVYGLWTDEQLSMLRQIIENDLGIPSSLQYFEESDE